RPAGGLAAGPAPGDDRDSPLRVLRDRLGLRGDRPAPPVEHRRGAPALPLPAGGLGSVRHRHGGRAGAAAGAGGAVTGTERGAAGPGGPALRALRGAGLQETGGEVAAMRGEGGWKGRTSFALPRTGPRTPPATTM